MNPRVLITGASSGIGAAFARAYAAKKHDLVLVARREQKLEKLAAECRAEFGVAVEVLVCDLADPGTPQSIKTALDDRRISVDILINNAGYGVPGTFVSNSWETHAASNQVMVTAVAELTRAFVPEMVSKHKGTIINVASIAGLIPSTGGHTLYGAVKSWMIHFSEALCAELKPMNIKVMAVCPGFTYSEFHDVTGTRATVSTLPRMFWLSSEQVAEKSIAALKVKRKPIYVPGKFNQFLVVLNRLLPKFVVTKLLDRYSSIARVTNI